MDQSRFRQEGTKVRCYNCNRAGHFAKNCRSPKRPRPPHQQLNILEQESDTPAEAEEPLDNFLGEPTINILTLKDSSDDPKEALPVYPVKLGDQTGR
jgi:Zinc knuckle